MSKTTEWFIELHERGELINTQPTVIMEEEITKNHIDRIGEQFTEFVHKNYHTLQHNYQLNVELEDYVSFPVFCYIEFSLMFNKDNGDGLS